MVRILEVRHGHSYANMGADNPTGINLNVRRFASDRLVTLTQLGKRQSTGTGKKIDEILTGWGHTGPVIVECSPYVRTVDTRDGACTQLQGRELIIMEPNELLIERSHTQAWELTARERAQRWPMQPEEWFTGCYPGSESFEKVANRGKAFKEMMKAKYPNDATIIIFGHGHQLRWLNMHLLGETAEKMRAEPEAENGSIRLIEGSDWESLKDSGYLHDGRITHPRASSKHAGPRVR